ncbi:MAG: hypothetical protein WC523_04355 [Patescibacteria group bacterium]
MAQEFEDYKIDGKSVDIIWDPMDLWGDLRHRGLARFDGGLFCPIIMSSANAVIFDTKLFTKENLINIDPAWKQAFEKIDDNVKSFWARKACTCGAWAVYGRKWAGHSSTCMINDTCCGPKNNDGQSECLKCKTKTISIFGWNSIINLCPNKQCEWFER